MSLAERVTRGLKATFASQVIYALANGALILILSSYLMDPDQYGLLYFTISILTLAGLLGTLGVPKSSARYTTEYAEKNEEQVPIIVRRSVLYVLVLSTTVSVIMVLFSGQIAAYVGREPLTYMLVIGTGYVIFRALTTFCTLIFQGLNRVDLSAVIRTVDAVARFVFAVGFVLVGFGAAGALAGYVLGYAVAAATGLAILYSKFYLPIPSADSMEEGLQRRILEYSVPLTATQSANILDKQIDTFLVGIFLTNAAVGFYTLAKQIAEFVVTPVSALGFTVSPAYGDQKAKDQLSQAARLYEESMRHVLLLYIPGAAGLALVADPLIRHIIGPDYLGTVPVLQILSAFVVFKAVNKITSNGLDYLGRARERAIAKGVTSIANFLLNILLIPTVGVVGAAIATVITYSIYTLVNVVIMHHEFSLAPWSVLRDTAMICGITAGMSAVVFLAMPYVSGLLTLAGAVLLGGVVWAILSIGSGMLDVRRVTSMLL